MHDTDTDAPTTTKPKPRWVECADAAAEVLTRTGGGQALTPEERDASVREAHAWMQLAYLYREDPALPADAPAPDA